MAHLWSSWCFGSSLFLFLFSVCSDYCRFSMSFFKIQFLPTSDFHHKHIQLINLPSSPISYRGRSHRLPIATPPPVANSTPSRLWHEYPFDMSRSCSDVAEWDAWMPLGVQLEELEKLGSQMLNALCRIDREGSPADMNFE
jgi:hypothetical protein